MNSTGKVINAMIGYYTGYVRRINHLLKVYGFAKAIGELERLDDSTQEILEIAAVTHDIGIKNSEIKYNSSAGNYQQIEGPPEARRLLEDLGIDIAVIDRVCWLIAHHHTYTDVHGIDYQILLEADFLVNADESGYSEAAIRRAMKGIFKTRTGTALLRSVYRLS